MKQYFVVTLLDCYRCSGTGELKDLYYDSTVTCEICEGKGKLIDKYVPLDKAMEEITK